MRLTRHAKNALRRIQRHAPSLSQELVLENIATAEPAGVDIKGNLRVLIRLEGVELELVVDFNLQEVVTLWEK